MVIYQITYIISNGDAVTNHVLNNDELLRRSGFQTKILTVASDEFLQNRRFDVYTQSIKKEDIVILHFASGTKLTDFFISLPCKKGIIYHNITPPVFLKNYSFINYKRTVLGRKQLKILAENSDFAFGVSEYNCKELIEAGFQKETVFLAPIIIHYNDYNIEPDEKLVQYFSEKKGTKILFTGRLSPNKKFEDCIKTFYYYKNFVDKNACLILAGSNRLSKYYAELVGFVSYLKLSDVYFTGHIPFTQLIAYYKIADVFLCMSEHEGFCVPLLEAMYFNVPVVAYASSAVPETLAQSGVLLNKKDFISASEEIRKISENPEWKEKILQEQQKRLEYFSTAHTEELFLKHLQRILEM